MSENMKKFLDAVKDNEELQKNLQAAGEDKTAIVTIIREAGFDITAADIDAEMARAPKGELSDDDLENVAGGISVTNTDEGVMISWAFDDRAVDVYNRVRQMGAQFQQWGVSVTAVNETIKKQGGEYWHGIPAEYRLGVAGYVKVYKDGRISLQ